MPRRYKTLQEEAEFGFTWIQSAYGVLKPIEEKLRAGGYSGPILADFDNEIYRANKVIDVEATRRKQEEADKRKGGKAPNVAPVYKTSDLRYNNRGYESEDKYTIRLESSVGYSLSLSKNATKDFLAYLKKVEDYLDLLIKNTPKEEYEEELKAVEFYKAQLRTLRVFGSSQVLADRFGFALNIRAYDSDVPCIPIAEGASGVSRELWRNVEKFYPYSSVRNAFASFMNTICDHEEGKIKDTYMEQLKYRERYRESVQNCYQTLKKLANDSKETERIAKIAIRDDIINERKNKNKDIDYEAVCNRVELQKKRGEASSDEDLAIYNDITNEVDTKYNPRMNNNETYNSKYMHELVAMGYITNEKDFTGERGCVRLYPEMEAQLNAIEMGWPIDEIPHIQRLVKMSAPIEKQGDPHTEKKLNVLKKAREFYENRIKDKPYPFDEAERKALYNEFYNISREVEAIFVFSFDSDMGHQDVEWKVFSKEIKETMRKPLTFTQKLLLRHHKDDPKVTFDKTKDLKSLNDIKTAIDKSRFGHSNSKEYNSLKQAYDEFYKIAGTEEVLNIFKVSDSKLLDDDKLKVLKNLRDSAEAYLNSKDKEKKYSTDRTTMGQNRYEGATKAFHIADDLIKLNDAEIKRRADAILEAKNKKGRKITVDAFADKDNEQMIKFNAYKAGGREQYKALVDEETKREADELKKDPANDEEKYERFINSLRTKKDDVVSLEDEKANNELQNKRVDDLAKMLAAIELQKDGKGFDEALISERAEDIKVIYSLSALKKSTETLNGPEKLKNALTYDFRAIDIKKELEMSLYEVGKVNCNNINKSQKQYKQDITKLLEGIDSGEIGVKAGGIVNALKEFNNINVEDDSLVVMNSYRLRQANVKLLRAVKTYMEQCEVIDKTNPEVKLALDSLAVLDTYTGCRAVTNKLICSLGNNSIKLDNFNTEFGVDNTKNIAIQLKKPQGKAQGGVLDNNAKNTKQGLAAGK